MRDVARSTRNISDRFNTTKTGNCGNFYSNFDEYWQRVVGLEPCGTKFADKWKNIERFTQSDIEMRIASLLESYDEQMQISTVSTTDALTHRWRVKPVCVTGHNLSAMYVSAADCVRRKYIMNGREKRKTMFNRLNRSMYFRAIRVRPGPNSKIFSSDFGTGRQRRSTAALYRAMSMPASKCRKHCHIWIRLRKL